MGERQILGMEVIELNWSDWTPWSEFHRNVRNGGPNLPREEGVYEAKIKDIEERLTIGKASSLRSGVKSWVRGKHSVGRKIGEAHRVGDIDVNDILIRWAITDRPYDAKSELHRQHRIKFGKGPIYYGQGGVSL